MIIVRANLIAGADHSKYAHGESFPALFFVKTVSAAELEAIASRELSERGWASMAIERYKDVTDFNQFAGKDTPEAVAFHEALHTGFGIVVYPPSGGT
ncbi:MAG: hypothetical protein ABL985_21240 [Casimicrobium sp.]